MGMGVGEGEAESVGMRRNVAGRACCLARAAPAHGTRAGEALLRGCAAQNCLRSKRLALTSANCAAGCLRCAQVCLR